MRRKREFCEESGCVLEGTELTQSIYADGYIMMVEATLNGARKLKEIIDESCDMSGERVNYSKSDLYFSDRVECRLKRRIVRIFNVKEEREPFKYLGMFLDGKRLPLK